MTTHWTKPQSCTWTYVDDGLPQLDSPGAVAWLDLEPMPGASTLSCYPDGMFFDGRTGVFSPATCPNGWTTVSLRVNTDEDAAQATTTAICCSSYVEAGGSVLPTRALTRPRSYYSLDGSHCKRSVPTVLAVPITYNHTASTYDVWTNSTTTLYNAAIAVNTIRALFMEQDKKRLGLANENEIGEGRSEYRPLSLGARIGIAFGVAGFVSMLLAAIALCVVKRKRSRRKRAKERGPHELGYVPHVYGPGGDGFPPDRSATEPPPAYEASTASSNPTDLDGDGAATRDHEIRTLVAQKAAIQRRLEELERMDNGDAHARSG